MKTRKSIFILAAFLFTATLPLLAQDDDEDEKKMIREVISVEVERPPAPIVPHVEEQHTGKKKKKKHVDPVIETPPVDTLAGTMIPAPIEELKKRGNAWMVKKNKEFKKLDPVGSGNTLECTITCIYQSKELNPGAPVDGKITMRVIIDCKEGKYRYTVRDVKHVADNAEFSGGDCYSEIPACGSMKFPDPQWKRVRSFAMQKANQIAFNLKDFMKNKINDKKDDW